VVDVYDVANAPDGRPFIVSELLKGKSWRSAAALAFSTPPLLRELFNAALRALGRAPARVIHRDLKPENLLCRRPNAPTVKVLDFASQIRNHARHNAYHIRMIIGTPAYHGARTGAGEKVDHRVDIYSVVQFYHLTTGKAFRRQ